MSLPPQRLPTLNGARPVDPLTGLLADIAMGSEAALAEFYAAAGRPVYALIMRLLRDHHLAEETTADVFLQIWRKARDFDPARGNPRTWVMTLARSRAIDRLRSGAARPETESDLDQQAEHTPGPEASANGHEMRGVVRGGLDVLPGPQRTAIELAYYGGLTQSEIASRLSEPIGTIKTRMRLGLQRLRDHLSTKDVRDVR
jgi:RNA polymerase sigma-70 factor (ECF subfamily)